MAVEQNSSGIQRQNVDKFRFRWRDGCLIKRVRKFSRIDHVFF